VGAQCAKRRQRDESVVGQLMRFSDKIEKRGRQLSSIPRWSHDRRGGSLAL